MQRIGIFIILLAIGFWTGCDKDAPIPNDLISGEDSTTICKLLKVSVVFKNLPQNNYTIDLRYQSQGRLDTAIIDYGDPKIAVKFFYSVDDTPDSLIVTFIPPSTDVGYEYRIYFVYDNARRQIETRYSTGHNIYYTYNSHDQLTMKVWDAIDDTTRYAYPNDTTHNFSSTTRRGPNGQVGWTQLYTYDNHPIPQRFPLGSPIEAGGYQPYTDNNVLKAAPAGQPPSNQFSYSYNEAGYPVQQRVVPGDHVVYSFSYACVTIPL